VAEAVAEEVEVEVGAEQAGVAERAAVALVEPEEVAAAGPRGPGPCS
jgi:hypothetical protein